MKKNIDLIIDGIAPEKVMYDTDNHSLVVLYPARKEFKRGDIVISQINQIGIFDSYNIVDAECFDTIWMYSGISKNKLSNNRWIAKYFALATPEDQQILFDALKKEGKKWNAETLEIEDLDISDIVVDLETACDYLKIERPSHFILDEACERSNKFEAQITLQLICEAWNKYDNFVPDSKNTKQDKHAPFWEIVDDAIGTFNLTDWLEFNGLIVFKTSERAIQFGNQFKELFKISMGI